MSALTTRLKLYKPGGGLTGLITPDEVVDIDKINSNMDLIDAAMGFFICTSTTRPAAPFGGQQIFETDTKNAMYWNSTASQWLPVGVPNVSSSAARDAIYPTPTGGERAYRTDLGYLQIYSAGQAAWRVDSTQGLVPIKPTSPHNTGGTLSIGPDGLVTLGSGLSGFDVMLFNNGTVEDFRVIECEYSIDAAAAAGQLSIQFTSDAAGTVITANNYYYDTNDVSTSGNSPVVAGPTATIVGGRYSATGSSGSFKIDGMMSTRRKRLYAGDSQDNDAYHRTHGGGITLTAQYVGLRFSFSQALAGNGATFMFYGKNKG